MSGNHQARPGRLSRRQLLGTAAGGSILAVGGGAVAASGFDWRRFAGQSLEVSLVKNPRTEILQARAGEFEDLTGVEIGIELVPEQQHRQKQVIEFASGRPSFDVTSVSWHVQKRLFGKARWLSDLRPLLADNEATAPDFAFEDFTAGALAFGTQADGRIDTLPLSLDYMLVYWNKPMFAAKGLAFPESFDALVQAAHQLNDPVKRQWGWIARGLKNANTYVWCSLVLGWNEALVRPDGTLDTAGPAAVEAAAMFADLCRSCAPPGTIGFNWNECQSAFAQGTAAIWPDSSGFATPLEDPTKSRLVGQVGYGIVPRGPSAHAVGLTGDALGIAAASPKQAAAYLYLQWATGKLNQARFLQNGAGAGGRASILADEAVLRDVKAPAGWIEAIKDSAALGRPTFPDIVPVTEFRDVFGIALTNMIAGADPRTELANATEQFKPILDKSERT